MQLGAPIAHTSNRPEAHSRYSDSDADRKQWCKKAEKMQLFVLQLLSAPRIKIMTATTSFQLRHSAPGLCTRFVVGGDADEWSFREHYT
jgi:hypothetical protein